MLSQTRTNVLLAGMLFLALLLAGCGIASSEGGARDAAEATLEAEIAEAERTPVDDTVRAYARQLCQPYAAFREDLADVLDEDTTLELQEASNEILGEFFVLVPLLGEQSARLATELEEADPPEDLREYHQGTIRLMRWVSAAADAMNALETGEEIEDLSHLAFPEVPDDPPGLDAAFLQECADDFRMAGQAFDYELLQLLETPASTHTPQPTLTPKPKPTQTPVDPATRAYAQALCPPFERWGEAPTVEAREHATPVLAAALREIAPSPSLAAFHERLIWLVENAENDRWQSATPAPLAPGSFFEGLIVEECGAVTQTVMLAAAPSLTQYLD